MQKFTFLTLAGIQRSSFQAFQVIHKATVSKGRITKKMVFDWNEMEQRLAQTKCNETSP